MKIWILCLFLSPIAQAQVISPNAVEVRFSFRSELESSEKGTARELALQQSKHLFGYMQNPEIVREWGLDRRNLGIGAPRWEPEIRVLETTRRGKNRKISYELSGLLLLHKDVATALLREGTWKIELPYDLDNFWDENCTDPEHPSRYDFWYFNNVFRKGCEHLREAPMAIPVTMQIAPASPLPADERVGLDRIRGDNGNGELFEIMAINGFDESSKSSRDNGRLNFQEMNQWFRHEGFEETVLSHFKNRPIHQFEKTLRKQDGSILRARVTRLLADTDLDEKKTVTFAKFLKNAIETSDVVIYEGHSGLGTNLDLKALEERLLLSRDKTVESRIDFNRSKQQIFFFDSCSSYSYYLGMFDGRKSPGTLGVITNGVESLFGNEISVTKRLYKQLINVNNDDLPWVDLLKSMEIPLRGNTFLLNVDVNH